MICEGSRDRTAAIDGCNHDWVRLQHGLRDGTVLVGVGFRSILEVFGIERQNLHSILNTSNCQ